MIKFFRNIRKKLLAENRFTKYLLYAVGEIVLVVIGILIALQINNYNAFKKEQTLLNASLISVKLNLDEDIENLNKQISYCNKVRNAVDFVFRIISLPEYENLPLSTFSDSVFHVATERTFRPTSTAFNSMESGSHFQWIKDQDLIQKMYEYYAFTDQLSDITIQNNEFVKSHMEGFTYNHMEFGSFLTNSNPYPKQRDPLKDNTNNFRESAVFENALIGRTFRARGEIEMSRAAILNAEELIAAIDAYLDSNN